MSKAVGSRFLLRHARPMLRNLLVAIFLIAIALPGFAMPVSAQTETPTATDCHSISVEYGKGEPVDDHAKRHDCIGCIASYPPAASIGAFERLAIIAMTEIVYELDGTISSPSTPPPRG